MLNIKDYFELDQQLDTLTPPWVTKDKAEKAHWKSLNAKAEKIAFVIANTPELNHKAKTLPKFSSISCPTGDVV